MMWHGAQAGAFDLRAAVMEAMTAFRRAGERGREDHLNQDHVRTKLAKFENLSLSLWFGPPSTLGQCFCQ